MPLSLLRVSLAHLPTPLDYLPRLTRELAGPRIFVKRDDLTGLAGGGNKVRKLEFLVAQALTLRCDSLVTIGAPQSNHCRQTAAAAARFGLRCILILRGDPPVEETGNLLLDHLLGAEIIWSRDRTREEVMDAVLESERTSGRKPYAIPLGGSNALGASSYLPAMEELASQTGEKFDRILVASSSGGTQAGMVAGAESAGFRGEVLGISIDEPADDLKEMVAGIATEVNGLIGNPVCFAPADILVNADYLGEGYGIMGEREREAIGLFARLEGILLDPVYTGRAAAGMIDLIRRGIIRKTETTLFWHTGGVPALWAYAHELRSHSRNL